MPKSKVNVFISVSGGVADVEEKTKGVTVFIRDYDNERAGEPRPCISVYHKNEIVKRRRP